MGRGGDKWREIESERMCEREKERCTYIRNIE